MNKAKNKLLLVFLLIILLSLYSLYYFNYFYVPIPDFFNFRNTAISFLNLTLPEDFQRAPLYPLLIGIFSLLFPFVNHPILFTAKIINLIFSIVSLVLIYLISNKLLNKGGFIVVWLWALNSETLNLIIQPLVEMSLLTTILFTIYLLIKGSRWVYIPLIFASLARYETILLIPIVVGYNLIYQKRKLITLLLGALSSVPIIIWLWLSIIHSGFINPYISIIKIQGFFNDFLFIKHCIYSIINDISSLIYFTPLIFLFLFLGIYSLIKSSFKEALPSLLFFVGYIVIHIIYPFSFSRFVFPISWIFYLSLVKGTEYIISIFSRYQYNNLQHIFKFGSFIFFLLFLLDNSNIIKELNENILIHLGYIGLILCYLNSQFKGKRDKKLFLLLLSSLFFSFFIRESIVANLNTMEGLRYWVGEHRAVGEWCKDNLKEDEKLVTTEPNIVSFYAGLPKEQFISLGSFKDKKSFIWELRRRKVTYVVWDSTWCDIYIAKKSNGKYLIKYRGGNYYFEIMKPFLIFELKEGKDKPHFKLIKKINVVKGTALIYKFIS